MKAADQLVLSLTTQLAQWVENTNVKINQKMIFLLWMIWQDQRIVEFNQGKYLFKECKRLTPLCTKTTSVGRTALPTRKCFYNSCPKLNSWTQVMGK